MWLKPGKRYLFGRVKKDGVQFAIDHKTVSRKHFIIEVSDVQDHEVSQIHARTKITIIDQNSKSGTTVNGNVLKGSDRPSKDLKSSDNSIRPGSVQDELIIRWQPCLLTFQLLKKELKAGALKTKQDRVKSLGIKAISDFASDHTTHLVARKRNTTKGLQALITGKYMVSESYVDAIEYAATPRSLDEEEDLSPLEVDFDTHWPDAKGYLPPPGKEPTARPVETYQPGPDRTNIFENFTFVFGDRSQQENLLDVITTGHGKALLFNVTNGQTTADEALQYMQNAAGMKSFGDMSAQSRRGGVIMVRWTPAPEHADWATDLINEVALKLDQRAIDQSEFLDAILANDATLLRQSVPFESYNDGLAAPPPTAQGSFASIKQKSQAQTHKSGTINGVSAGPAAPRTLNSQADGGRVPLDESNPMSNGVSQSPSAVEELQQSPPVVRRRFEAHAPAQVKFDDGFDENAIAAYDSSDEAEDEDGPSRIVDSEAESAVKPEPPSTSRKRRRSESPAGNDLDDLLPAANAMKRQRLEAEAQARRGGKPLRSAQLSASPIKPKKKKEKEIDVREVARAQREKEAAARREQQELEERLPAHDENDRAPANLVQIEVIEMPIRANKPVARMNPEDDPRWDPKWNGRKNFKKFRPQQAGPARRTGHAAKVIVPLIAVKNASDGLGDKYWDKTPEEKAREKRRKDKAKSQRSQTQSQSTRPTASTERIEIASEGESDASARHTSPANTRLQQEAASIVDHEIDPDSPRTTRSKDHRGPTQTQTQTQTQAPTQGTKRPASRPAPTAAKKRQKTLPVTTIHGSDSEQDDDSDDMKFKFGSRKRAKGRT